MKDQFLLARIIGITLLGLFAVSCGNPSVQHALIMMGVIDEHTDAIQLEWLIDGTPGSPGADASILETHVPIIVDYLASRPRGVLHVWRTGTSAATTDLVFTLEAPGPEKTSKAATDAYRAAFTRDAKPKLQQAIAELLRQRPPQISPIIESLTVVANNSVRQNHKKVILVTTDLRDVTPNAGRNFECGPIPTDTDAFLRNLHEQALLPPDSLKGVPVLFTFAGIRPVYGNVCAQPQARWTQLTALWQSSLSATGARTTFYTRQLNVTDLTGLTMAWMLVPLFSPGMFVRRTYWSLWVWLTARSDARKRIYAPKDALCRRLQYYPRFDVIRNPMDQEMEALYLDAAYRFEQVTQRIDALLQRLAEHFPFWVLVIAATLLLLFETVGITVLVRDAGIVGAERIITGILVALGAIFLTAVLWVLAERLEAARKKNDVAAIRRSTIQLALAVVGYTVVVLALVLVRLFALVGATEVGVGAVAMAIVLGLSVLGAPWMTKFVLREIAVVLPDQRRLWQARKELGEAKKALGKARGYKARREGQRLFWLQEGSRLLAMYNIKHRHSCPASTDKWGNPIVYISDPDAVAQDGQRAEAEKEDRPW